jgi:Xaa-Pro aminopeptidase
MTAPALADLPQPIADAEHAQRTQAVRSVLADRRLDVLLAYGAHRDYRPGDLRWLARWYCVEEETACVVVPRDGPVTLVTDASWDVERAEAEAYADAVRFGPDLGATLAELVRESCGEHPRIGIAGFEVLPVPVWQRLREALPEADIEEAGEVTTDLRMVKSPAELSLMRAASRISDAAMLAGLERVRDGAREIEVAAAAEAVIRGAGAEPSFVTEMGSGPRLAYGTFLPGTRTLAVGELAVLDCGARVHGYHGDMCRTVVVGGPDGRQRAMLEAVERAVSDAIAVMAPGVTVGEVRDAAAESIAGSGFADNWWDAFMPHGNGAGQHEPPNAKEHPHLPLRDGMVLCIEPGITVPGEGAVIIEQMVTVTTDGAEVLNALPTDMWDRL